MAVQRRYSHQREQIYNYLLHTCDHPSAENVYSALKPTMPELSLGTVYRNLALLEEMGLVQKVAHVNDVVRYDACCHNHAHFVCTKCGSVHDFNEVDCNAITSTLNLPDGFTVSSLNLTIKGLCPNCKETN